MGRRVDPGQSAAQAALALLKSGKLESETGMILRRVPILTYHWFTDNKHMGPTKWSHLGLTPDEFVSQMYYLWQKGFHTISLDDLATHLLEHTPLPEKPIIITFDDGYEDFFHHAYPILRRFNLTATVFLVSSLVGQTNLWDQKIGEPVRKLLKWEQIKELGGHGISFGSHTCSHPDLTQLTPDHVRREIADSRTTIAQKIGKPVTFFSYPYGEWNETIRQMVIESGYIGACSITPKDQSLLRDDIYALSRITVCGDEGMLGFRLELLRHCTARRRKVMNPLIARAKKVARLLEPR
jgi:peptidoglycan/xylan/chitin deacetylase (PgdA/CDA1 family)